MRIGYGDLWVDITKDDITIIRNTLNLVLSKIKDSIVKQEFKVCEVDGVYYTTGYISEYHKLRCTKNQLINLLEKDVYNIKNSKYIIFTSGELSGFESDTPDISEYDIIIDWK